MPMTRSVLDRGLLRLFGSLSAYDIFSVNNRESFYVTIASLARSDTSGALKLAVIALIATGSAYLFQGSW